MRDIIATYPLWCGVVDICSQVSRVCPAHAVRRRKGKRRKGAEVEEREEGTSSVGGAWNCGIFISAVICVGDLYLWVIGINTGGLLWDDDI